MENPLIPSPPLSFRRSKVPSYKLSYTLNGIVLQIDLTKLAGFCWKVEATTIPLHFLGVILPVLTKLFMFTVGTASTPLTMGCWGPGGMGCLSGWALQSSIHSTKKSHKIHQPKNTAKDISSLNITRGWSIFAPSSPNLVAFWTQSERLLCAITLGRMADLTFLVVM